MIFLTSNGMPGAVTVTAEANVPGSTDKITATTTVTVVDWGAIGGTVFDQSSAPVPGARVSLKYESGDPYRVPENPQNTSTQTAPIGSFSFYRIPVGKYVLSWEASSVSRSLPVTVSPGTATVIFNENRSLLFPGYTDAPDGHTTLYGYVLDRSKNGIPAATVELYHTAYNSSGNCWDTLTPVAQTQANRSLNYSGLYNFSTVPYGTYKVVANKMDASGNNHSDYAIVTLNSSGQVAYVVIPALVHHPFPVTPTPVATPVGQTTLVPTSIPTSAHASAESSGETIPAVSAIIVAVGLLLIVLRRSSGG